MDMDIDTDMDMDMDTSYRIMDNRLSEKILLKLLDCWNIYYQASQLE
jgi:hypothetical protein